MKTYYKLLIIEDKCFPMCANQSYQAAYEAGLTCSIIVIQRYLHRRIITLQCLPVNSRLEITDRSFTHHTPALRNSLPKTLAILYRTRHLLIYHTTNHYLLALSACSFTPSYRLIHQSQPFPP